MCGNSVYQVLSPLPTDQAPGYEVSWQATQATKLHATATLNHSTYYDNLPSMNLVIGHCLHNITQFKHIAMMP